MSYYYDDKTQTVKRKPMPKLTEEEFEILDKAKPNKKFLKKILSLKIKTINPFDDMSDDVKKVCIDKY